MYHSLFCIHTVEISEIENRKVVDMPMKPKDNSLEKKNNKIDKPLPRFNSSKREKTQLTRIRNE